MERVNLRLIIFGAIFVVGIIILMNCINLGDGEVYNIMKAQGGTIGAENYLIYLELSITKFIYVGSILSILGGLGVLKNTSIKS